MGTGNDFKRVHTGRTPNKKLCRTTLVLLSIAAQSTCPGTPSVVFRITTRQVMKILFVGQRKEDMYRLNLPHFNTKRDGPLSLLLFQMKIQKLTRTLTQRNLF